jgi:DNA-directed RNA polymerase subunit RPC12/RpoP
MESEPEQTVPHCPECKKHVLLVEIQEPNYDWQCPRCHRKFKMLKMETKTDKDGNEKIISYKLRGYRILHKARSVSVRKA